MYIFEDFENKEQIKTLLSQYGMRFLQKRRKKERPEDQKLQVLFYFFFCRCSFCTVPVVTPSPSFG